MKRMSVVAFLAVLLASLGANAYAQFNVFSIPQKSGIITASDCSGYTSLGQLCQDTDDGKLYKGTGSAIEEISGTGVSTYAEIEALADYPAVVVSEGTITADHSVCWNNDGTAVISCGAPVAMDEDITTGRLKYNSTSGEVENEVGAGDYDTVASAETGTGNINIDGVSAADYNYSNGASDATYTYVITSPPAAGKVRYITLTIGGGAGVVTSVWTNIAWIGTAGAETTTTNKKSTYACIIRNTGSQCKIVQEAY